MTLLAMLENTINEMERKIMVLQQQLDQASKAIDELKNSNKQNPKK